MKKLSFNAGAILFRWVAPLLVLGCAAWFVYAMGAQDKPKRKKAPPRKSIAVEVVQAKSHLDTLDIVSRGVVIPHREVKLSTRVAGEVVFKSDLLSPGQFVHKDDVLIRIDPTDYELEVARLKQELAKVDVDLEQIKVDRENSERLLEINRKIVALKRVDDSRFDRLRTANAASDTEVDAAQLSVLTAIEKVTDNENRLRAFDSQAKSLVMSRELAKIQLERAQLDLSRTEILAPFSGVVIENHVEQDSNIANGAMIATIEDTSMAEVRCNLRADEMEFIYDSAPAEPLTIPSISDNLLTTESQSPADPPTKTDATKQSRKRSAAAYRLPAVPVTIEYQRGGQTFQWTGTLSRQDGLGVEQDTRTVPVRILVENPTTNIGADQSPASPTARPLALVRGMFVKIKLHCQPRMPLMVIPEAVLRPGKNVWLMRDGKLNIETIRITRIEEGRAYFDPRNSSITKQDQIISSPVPNAKEGLPVALKSNEKRAGGKASKSGNKSQAGKPENAQGKKGTSTPKASQQ